MTNDLDLEAEAVLDPDIHFQPPENLTNPKSIFLTGSTGFLGAFLLEELLQKTTADIYCLIRAEDIEAGKKRCKEHLQSYSLWNEEFNSRLYPIAGDLGKPLFGLSQEQFNQLANKVDVIYHNGAYVNFVRPYSILKTINVLGTQEVLRLASLIKTKPVHYISSLAVFLKKNGQGEEQARENDILDPAGLKGGYEQSKWVAEQLILKAQQRGLPAIIYRPSRIMGHSQTGMTGNFDDLLCIILKACIELGKFPGLDEDITLVPVNYVSQGIVYLSQQEKCFGKTFHFAHSHPIKLKNFFGIVRSSGYPLEETSYQGWLKELQALSLHHKEKKLFLSLILCLRLPNYFFAKKPRFDARQTDEFLAGTSISYPPIGEELISTYLSYFQKCGFISSF